MEATENGKYMIKASTILDITLQDYHKSRQQYGNEFGRENEKSGGDFNNNMNHMNMNMGMEMNNNNNNLNMDANNIMEVIIKKIIFNIIE